MMTRLKSNVKLLGSVVVVVVVAVADAQRSR
jgi:hypothetical protein